MIGSLMVTVCAAVIAELLHQTAPGYFVDHSGFLGDFIAWRWVTLTMLGVMSALSIIAYASIDREAVDLTGSTVRYDENGVSIVSDGVRWMKVGTRTWPSGEQRIEVEEWCKDHPVRLLYWNQSQKRPEAIRHAYGQTRTRALLCPGQMDGEQHEVQLTQSKTLAIAKRLALPRLEAAARPNADFVQEGA